MFLFWAYNKINLFLGKKNNMPDTLQNQLNSARKQRNLLVAITLMNLGLCGFVLASATVALWVAPIWLAAATFNGLNARGHQKKVRQLTAVIKVIHDVEEKKANEILMDLNLHRPAGLSPKNRKKVGSSKEVAQALNCQATTESLMQDFAQSQKPSSGENVSPNPAISEGFRKRRP